MPDILPVSDLKNYNEILKNCQSDEYVFTTKSEREKGVIIDVEGWLSLEELKKGYRY